MTDPKRPDSETTSSENLQDKVKTTASAVVDQVKGEGRRAVDGIRESAERFGEERKDEAAKRVGRVAGALRGASNDLRADDEKAVAAVADQAADRLDRFSDALSRKDLKTLFEDANDLARQHPAVFLGGAVMLGFMAGRFIRSSGSRDTDDGHRGPTTSTQHAAAPGGHDGATRG